MKTVFVLWIHVLVFITPGFSQESLIQTPGGAKYRIIKSQNSKKIELGNIITVNFKMLTQEGKILYSSYDNPDVYKLQVHKSEEIVDLMDVFVNLHDKDSAIVLIPSDSIYANPDLTRPHYLPSKSDLVFLLKIERVQTEEEVLVEEKVAFDKEREQLLKYLKDNNLNPQVTKSGLLYVVIKAGKGAKPVEGDTVSINYVASSIGANVFDTNIEHEAEKAGLTRPGKKYKPMRFVIGETGLITPWDEAVMMLNEGSKGKLIIPSFLAFGARGLGKIVKPYTTFIIEIDVLKVQRPLMKSFAEKDSKEKKAPKKVEGINYLPAQIARNFSSFLLLMNDDRSQSGRTYNTLSQPEKPWYMIWWNSIIRVLN